MNAQEIATVSDILVTDETVLKSWKRLYAFLEIHGNSVQLQNQFNNGMLTSHELFTAILTKWGTQNGSDATVEKFSSILVKLNYKSVSEKLQKQFAITNLSNGMTFELLNPTKNFIGRKIELQKIQSILETGEEVVHIVGLGGVGKSELARKFAHINRGKINIIWLNGETLESLTNSIIRLAVLTQVIATGHQNSSRKLMEIFQDVMIKINNLNHFTTLLIIDNVDATDEHVQLLLNNTTELHCVALVTSRHVGVLDFAGEIISLEVFSPEDAQQLLQNSIKEETVDDIKTLANLLQFFPLALQQAIAFIKKQKIVGVLGHSYKILNYIEEYETQKTKMLNFPLNLIEHKYRETTLITWNISIDQIKINETIGKLAIELLNVISYCYADNISVELTQTISSCPYEIVRALELLKSYSLIKVENNQTSIHRLVQEVVRLNCVSSNIEQHVLTAICQAMKVSVIKTLQQNDMTHILSIWNHIFKHDHIIKTFCNQPSIIIIKLHDFSQHRELTKFANLSYERFVTVLGEENLQTLGLERCRALAAMKNGTYKEALDKYKTALDKMERTLGKEHVLTLYTRLDMASVLRCLERHEEALQQHRTVLKSLTTVQGESHKDTMNAKTNLASVLMVQGKLIEAIHIYEEVLDWQLINRGSEHSDTLVTRHNIGHCLHEQGEFQKAKTIFQHVHELNVQVRGEEHCSTLMTKHKLGIVLGELGEVENGLQMLNQVLTSRQKVLGKHHPDTLATRSHIATILYGKEEYDNVKDILEEDLPLWIQSQGNQHSETFWMRVLLALTLHKLGKNEQALKLLQQLLVTRKKMFAPDHQDTLLTQSLIDLITTELASTDQSKITHP